MIPILYDKSETAFTSGGLGFLSDCVDFKVTEELNGIYECEFNYPITGSLYSYLTEGNIVYATHDDTEVPQPFDIYSHSAPINGIVTFYAHHISYRLSNIIIATAASSDIGSTMSMLGSSFTMPNPFTFSTDIENNTGMTVSVPAIVRTLLNGEGDTTVLKKYGGELEYDKFHVYLWERRGSDTDVEIRYGKNLSDITDKVDSSESYNAVVPYWQSDDKTTLVTLTRGYVSHDDGSGMIKAVVLDMKPYFSTKPTKQAMADKAQEIIDASYAWIASREVTVDFVALWQTAEYKDFAPLERVNLGDTVKVYYPAIGVNAIQERVVKTVYNTLLDRYDEITLNQLPSTLGELFNQQTEAQANITATDLASAVALAVNLVQGKSGGYVYTETDADSKPTSIMFMDTADSSTATNVLKLDQTGFSYSTTGIAGPFTALVSMSSGQVTIHGDLTVTGTINN